MDDAVSGVSRDSRGILDPGRFSRHVRFGRFQPPPDLAGVVDWFWSVQWEFPPGELFVQQVLTHPSTNLSVGSVSSRGIDDNRIEATAVGVQTSVDSRRLTGHGWNVAAKLVPGGLGALTTQEAASLTNRVVPLGDVLALDGVRVAAELTDAAGDVAEQSRRLAGALIDALSDVPAERREMAAEAIRAARLAELERSIRTVAELAEHTQVGARSLQRMFRASVGVSPLWLIRRYRLIDAADAARSGRPTSWAELAADLGYADQAHLVRDFRATLRITPAAYAASVTPLE